MQNSEKEILNIIKYLPVILILLVSFLLTFFLYTENMDRFEKEEQDLESRYISLNKDLIKFQIEKIKSRILEEKKNKIIVLKKELRNQVLNAYNIANSIYKNNQNKSQEEIISLIKDALREIRYNDGRGYLFIYESKGDVVLHPIKPQLESKNLWNYQDKKGTYLLQEMYKILQEKDDTFYSWHWTKPNDDNKEYEKLGYFKKFEPFDWFIGTGEYVYDFGENIRKSLLEEIVNFRYNNNGYIFILDYDGTYLSYHDKSYIGKNVYDLFITDDVKTIQSKLIDLSLKSGGYITYSHKDKPLTHEHVSKVSYIDGIPDWKWIIGTGFYMDDFYEEIKDKRKKLSIENDNALKKLLIISSLSTALVLILFFYITSILERRFMEYKKSIAKQINDNIKKDNILAQQSKLAVMGEVVGDIVNQLRQPLSTVRRDKKIKSNSVLKDEISEKESLEKINKHIQYLSHTIDDFKNFFKLNKEAKSFEMSNMINKTLELFELQFENKNIKVIKDIDEITVFSFENELIQVLINLLNNARDELANKNGERFIFIKLKKENEKFVLIVKDNAGGVIEDNIDKIFEPYFTTKENSKGTGIGLFMSEEIILRHLAGEISVENKNYFYNEKEYKGASFKIIIPLNFCKTKENLS